MPDLVLRLDDQDRRYSGTEVSGDVESPIFRALVDQVCKEVASKISAKRYDFDNCEKSLLPFYAYELRSVNYTELISVRHARESLKISSRLYELCGSEGAWIVFCGSLDSVASFEYTTGETPERTTGVDLFFSPPFRFVASTEVLAHMIRVAIS